MRTVNGAPRQVVNRRLMPSKWPSRLVWPIVLLGFLASLPSLVQGQNLGYVVNTNDGTVTIFGTVQGSSGNPIDSNIQTVFVCKQPTAAAAHTNAVFLASPPPNQPDTLYVTCADNSLWAIDLTNLGLGQPLVPQNINVGNPLQLSLPTGIVINSVTCTGMDDLADDCYHDIAFIVNSQTNTVSMMDTATNSFLEGLTITTLGAPETFPVTNPIQLGPPGSGPPPYPAQISTAYYLADEVFVTTNNPDPELWMIDILDYLSPPPSSFLTGTQVLQNNGQAILNSASSPIFLAETNVGVPEIFYESDVVLTYSSPQVPDQMLLVHVPETNPSTSLVVPVTLGSSPPAHNLAFAVSGQSVTDYTIDEGGNLWQVTFPYINNDDGLYVPTGTSTATSVQLAASGSAPNGLGDPAFLTYASGVPPYFYLTDGTRKMRIVPSVFTTNQTPPNVFSSVVIGNGSQSPVFSGIDPFAAPICWFGGTLQTTPSGVVPVLSTLASAPENSVIGVCSSSADYTPPMTAQTAAQASRRPLSVHSTRRPAVTDATDASCTTDCPNFVTTSVDMGSFGGQSGTCIAQVEGAQGNGATCTLTSSQQGVTVLPTQASFPASGVYTVSTTGGATSTTTQGSTQRQAQVGANCTATISPVTVGVGQPVAATLMCTTPVSDQGGVSATIDWGDSTSPSQCSGGACRTFTDGPYSESVTISFSHSYGTATPSGQSSYSATVPTLTDDTEDGVAGYLSTPQPIAVTVAPIGITLTPAQATVQAEHNTAIMAAVAYDVTNSGVRWALSGAGCTGTACGTLANITTTSVTYNAPAVVPSPAAVTLTATSLSTNQPTVMSSVPISITSLPSPSCMTSGGSSTSALAGQSVTFAISCTAPANDTLSATVNWNDGSTSSSASTTANSAGSASFTFSHTYSAAGNYSPSVTITDMTTTIVGTPPTVAITVYATPTLAPASSSQTTVTIAQGQSITVPFVFNGGSIDAGLTFSPITCQASPAGGPTCSVSPSSFTLNASGQGTLQVTISTIGPAASSLVLPRDESASAKRSASLFLLLGLGTLCLAFAWYGRTFQTRRGFFLLIAVAVCTSMCLIACSTAQQADTSCASCTPAATYTVTISTSSVKPVFPVSGSFQVVVTM